LEERSVAAGQSGEAATATVVSCTTKGLRKTNTPDSESVDVAVIVDDDELCKDEQAAARSPSWSKKEPYDWWTGILFIGSGQGIQSEREGYAGFVRTEESGRQLLPKCAILYWEEANPFRSSVLWCRGSGFAQRDGAHRLVVIGAGHCKRRIACEGCGASARFGPCYDSGRKSSECTTSRQQCDDAKA
jgi:hypothetical protein